MSSLPCPDQACRDQDVMAIETGCIDFDALMARCLGNMQLVERVIGKFKVQVDADIDAFQYAIDAGDCEGATLVAHRLKGIAGSIGAQRLFGDASEAEQLGLENQLNKLPDFLDRMRKDRTQITEAFSRRESIRRPSRV